MIPARKGLQHQATVEQVAAGAAIFLWRRDPAETSCTDLLKNLIWPPLVAVHARRQRVEFAPSELVGALEQGLLLIVDIEGH